MVSIDFKLINKAPRSKINYVAKYRNPYALNRGLHLPSPNPACETTANSNL